LHTITLSGMHAPALARARTHTHTHTHTHKLGRTPLHLCKRHGSVAENPTWQRTIIERERISCPRGESNP